MLREVNPGNISHPSDLPDLHSFYSVIKLCACCRQHWTTFSSQALRFFYFYFFIFCFKALRLVQRAVLWCFIVAIGWQCCISTATKANYFSMEVF